MTVTDTAVSVNTIGYVAFETPDVARLTDYYTRALGFEVISQDEQDAYLSVDGSLHTVAIHRSDQARGRVRVGYRIDETVRDAAARLGAAGYDVETRSDVSPTETDVVRILEPDTGMPLHLYSSSVPVAPLAEGEHSPTKLGHVAAFAPDLHRMQDFYQGLLGFEWSDTIGDFFVFMRCNRDHHAANFLQSTKASGMHHIAYEMRDLDHLQTILDHLAKNDVRLFWGPGRHGPGHNIFTYHRDPDGNTIELFTQLDAWDENLGAFEPRPWHDEHPQIPRTWEADLMAQNSWGPGNPSMRDR